MTPELEQRLKEIETREKMATEGDWQAWGVIPPIVENGIITIQDEGEKEWTVKSQYYDEQNRRCTAHIASVEGVRSFDGNENESNAEFTAHAHSDIPFLLSALREAEAEIERVGITDKARFESSMTELRKDLGLAPSSTEDIPLRVELISNATKNRGCRCVRCICDDDEQCQGCGARECGYHYGIRVKLEVNLKKARTEITQLREVLEMYPEWNNSGHCEICQWGTEEKGHTANCKRQSALTTVEKVGKLVDKDSKGGG